MTKIRLDHNTPSQVRERRVKTYAAEREDMRTLRYRLPHVACKGASNDLESEQWNYEKVK